MLEKLMYEAKKANVNKFEKVLNFEYEESVKTVQDLNTIRVIK